jgi:unsaturated chondroitin disaccharide hydrolase
MPSDTKSRMDITAAQRELFLKTLDRMAKKVAEDEPALGVEFPHVTALNSS